MYLTTQKYSYVAVQGGGTIFPYTSGYLKCSFTWKGRCPVERRFKFIFLDERLIEAVLNWRQHEYIEFPIFPKLPGDVTFHHIYYDYIRRAFGVCVHSDEFGIVPDGHEIPKIDGIYEFEMIQLSMEREKNGNGSNNPG